MDAFDRLIEVAKTLNSPGGCPWDIKQTFHSLQKYVIEEGHELVEAVDGGDDKHVLEELGDLFYVVIFYAMVAEREGRFTLDEIIDHEREKLIRRHPHVFGKEEVKEADEVLKVWERVKSEEKKERRTLLEGIPKGLDLIMRAQKVLEKIKRHNLDHFLEPAEDDVTEDAIGKRLLEIVYLAASRDIDAMGALRRELSSVEKRMENL